MGAILQLTLDEWALFAGIWSAAGMYLIYFSFVYLPIILIITAWILPIVCIQIYGLKTKEQVNDRK